ncbi:DUF6602 domain-containing protein [Vibrio splendidus]|uniref:DUF6602 domain-containing protein n=1 Tax=Vibrio splendidus TaxID=29497 RepID=A0A7Y4DBQ6_VIBSP|nr:DUF6602 domain-containing protein [Vibrio splendidus]NOJ15864.1 hypothetical protein [Vibrio splendidus]
MIKNVSELLLQLSKKEEIAIARQEIKHAPTIGAMYEGLTKNMLNVALPKEVDIRVASGFIKDSLGNKSQQIDCMIVTGLGEKLPHIDEYIFHVKQVLAVIEIKKSLHSSQLLSAHTLHNSVLDLFDSYSQSDDFREFHTRYAAYEFSSISGKHAPQYNSEDFRNLSLNEKAIYHALVLEQLTPLRIILGYNGFKSEFALREAYSDILENNITQSGFAVRNIPQLVISNGYSLVKTNGMPYTSTISDCGWWGVLTSSNANPIYLLLEILFTKMEMYFGISFDWGDDLREENLVHFLAARAYQTERVLGWEVSVNSPEREQFIGREAYSHWEPLEVDESVFRLVELLSSESSGDLYFDNPRLIELLNKFSLTLDELKLLAVDTKIIVTNQSGFLACTNIGFCRYNGKYLVANDLSGRFNRWLQRPPQ